MAVYAVGDIQGCALPFEALLEKIRFNPSADTIWIAGDLINRGPNSLDTLRLVKSLGNSAITILGNHDLHFLSVACGLRNTHSKDTLKPILKSPDCAELADWIRHRPLLHIDKNLKTLMVHAGVYPGWRKSDLVGYAREVEGILRGPDYQDFLRNMYGNKPVKWSANLKGWQRYRFIINSLTRMRYVDADGNLNFTQKGAPGSQPTKWIAWFNHPQLQCQKWRIVFGHWSSLGYFQAGNIVSLDSGCVWGGKLTAIQLDCKDKTPCWQINCG